MFRNFLNFLVNDELVYIQVADPANVGLLEKPHKKFHLPLQSAPIFKKNKKRPAPSRKPTLLIRGLIGYSPSNSRY